MFNEIWPLISVVLGIIILLVLIIGFKLNTFISLIITSMITALMLGIPLTKIMETIEKGMGSTLGHIALIFGLGAILGKLLADGGGATRIADTLIQKFGQKHVQWAMLVAAFIVGIALFFEVGLVLLIPLVFTVAKRANVSVLKLGLPMVTALSVTHGFLPPLALGSATVAAISTTGIVLPLLQSSDVNVALVVLAIGAGSVILSHVNDAGFWMFKEYFGLTVKETFLTWSLLETIISVSGIIFILFISLFV